MKILFINGSPNKDGNTKALADTLLKGHEYETLNLVDYQIGVYGQKIAGDQFGEVLDKVKKADVLVIGSPMYWHNICGAVRTMLDRFYGPVTSGSLKGKKVSGSSSGEMDAGRRQFYNVQICRPLWTDI